MKKPLLSHLSALILLISGYVSAQPAILWDKTVAAPGGGTLTCSQQTADGGYILGGYAEAGTGLDKSARGNSQTDYWIVKLGADGKKEWDHAYGGPGTDILVAIRQTADGGYILGGNSNSDAGGDKSENNRSGYSDGFRQYDYWVVKISSKGIREWDKTLGGRRDETMASIEQTPDGGYIIGGSSTSGAGFDKSGAAYGSGDFWVVKLSARGSKQWEKTCGSTAIEDYGQVRATADGGYILAGTIDDYQSSRQADYKVVRLSSAGTVVWQKQFGGTGRDVLTCIETTSDGGFVVGGYSDSNADGDKSGTSQVGTYSSERIRDYWVLKLSAAGTKQWDKTIGGLIYDAGGYSGGDSFLKSVAQTSDGGFILGGYSSARGGRSKTENNKNTGKGSTDDYWIVKLNAKGTRLWDKTLGGTATDRLQHVLQTRDGGFLVSGFSESGISGDKTESPAEIPANTANFWSVRLDAAPAANQLALSASSLTFSCDPAEPAVPQQVTLTATAGAPALRIVKSENTPWLKLPQPATGRLTFSVDAAGLAPGVYRSTVTIFATGYGRVVLPVNMNVTSGEEGEVLVAINAGDKAYTTADGRQFTADQYYAGTDRTTSVAGEILNTSDDVLYRSGRCSPSFSYDIPVSNGTVEVVLHFAETWYGAPGGGAGGTGKRKFHVDMEGSRKLTDFDIYARAGGAMRAITQTIPVTVKDGVLNINFLSGAADMPRVSAIEVKTATSSTQLARMSGGDEAESAAMEADRAEQGPQASVVYPNPARDYINVTLSSGHTGEIFFDLVNAAGTAYRLKPVREAAGSISIPLAGLNITAGIHVLRVRSGSKIEMIRVMVVD